MGTGSSLTVGDVAHLELGIPEQRDNATVDQRTDRPGLDAAAVHALSNHLAVILGFIELVLSETPETDTRRADLEEVRQAAHECARIVNQSHHGQG